MKDMDYRTEEICILYIKKLLDKFYVYVYLGVAKISCIQYKLLSTIKLTHLKPNELGNFKPHKL